MFLKHQTFKTFLASRSTGNLVVRKKSRAPFFDEGLNLANARVQLELAPPLSWLPVLQRCNTFDIMCSTCCTMNVVARSKDQLTYATLQQFFGDDNTWKHKSSSGWCCCRKKLKSWNIKKTSGLLNFKTTPPPNPWPWLWQRSWHFQQLWPQVWSRLIGLKPYLQNGSKVFNTGVCEIAFDLTDPPTYKICGEADWPFFGENTESVLGSKLHLQVCWLGRR